MNLKYTIGAVVIGLLFIGGAWLFQDEGTTSKNNAPQSSGGQVYDAPAQTQAPKNSSSGDANF
jgi:hypothetical protein